AACAIASTAAAVRSAAPRFDEENPERRATMAQAALAFSSSNRGAAERTAAAVLAIAQAAEPVTAAGEPLDEEPTR
ncbi:hypothetical protein, partial [Bacillus cereus]|uniref:hypothetical protein n=1 Tax=Bacillus cereus TaxID=1396 RepID=UPI001C3F4204